MIREFGAILRGMADAKLESAFAGEWIHLDSKRRKWIMQDFLEASEDEGLTAAEYQRRIGVGSLKSYGDVMLSRASQGW